MLEPRNLAPVAETGFSHRLTACKIVGHFFGRHIGKYRGVIRSKIVFFRISNISVSFPHAQLRGRTVIKKLWTFFGPWGRDRSQSSPCWIYRVKQIHQSTASERTTWQRGTISKIVERPYVDAAHTRDRWDRVQAEMSHWANVVLMLCHRLQRWPNIKTTLVQCLIFVGMRVLKEKIKHSRMIVCQRLSCNVRGSDNGLLFGFATCSALDTARGALHS